MSAKEDINVIELETILKDRYNDKIVDIIRKFLLEYIDTDINSFYDVDEVREKNTKYWISLIIEDDKVAGIEVCYVPISVLLESDCYFSSEDYNACSRRVLFDDNIGFILESCNINFDIFTPAKDIHRIKYRIETNQQSYDSSGVMMAKRYGVKRGHFKKIDSSDLILKLEYYLININYDELFDEGFKIVHDNLEFFSDPRIILLVECVRISLDVAFINVLKGIYTVSSKFDTYFKLPNECIINLPDISFCKELDHEEYNLDYNVDSKTIDECINDLTKAVELGEIDEVQKDFLFRLCQINSRDSIHSVGYGYRKIKRLSRV